MNLTPSRKNAVTKHTSFFPELSSFRAEINSLFDQFFRGSSFSRPSRSGGTWLPSIDVRDSEKDLIITCDVPGVDPKDVDVSLKGDLLIIKGQKKTESTEENEHYYIAERESGSFLRTIELPETIDTDSIKAEQKDGVLTVQLKKRPDAAQKKIPITSLK